MIKKLKKAFTITELVIVIAVIAILAAVLIPTFTTLIDKANQSSDISAVRDMNLALKNAEAAGNKPEGASQAMDILEEANLDARGYKALAGDHVIYYNLDLNAVLYMYVGEDGYVVEFPAEYKDVSFYDESYTGKWFDLSARMAGDETWKNATQVPVTQLSTLLVTTAPNEGEEVTETETTSAVIMNGDKIVGAKVDTAPRLVSVVEYIETLEDEGENFTLILGNNVDLMNSEWKPISEYRGNFYGNYHTIDNMQITDATAEAEPYSAATDKNDYYYYGFISVFSGTAFENVVFDNVIIDQPGQSYDIGEGHERGNHTVGGAIGGVIVPKKDYTSKDEVSIKNVVVNGSITAFSRGGGIIGYIGGYQATEGDKSGNNLMECTVVVEGCVNNAVIKTNGYNVYRTGGGILGTSNQRAAISKILISDCVNNGDITAARAGGIVSDLHGTGTISISLCVNNGNLATTCTQTQNTYLWGGAGGIIAFLPCNNTYNITISNCTNAGDIIDEVQIDTHKISLGYIIGGADHGSYGNGQTTWTMSLTLSGNENSGGTFVKNDEHVTLEGIRLNGNYKSPSETTVQDWLRVND